MMQQHIALERFSAATGPQQDGSAVLRALKKWTNMETVTAFGHLPEAWIPQLISLAVAEGELPLLQEMFLSKLAWRHADAHEAAAMAHSACIAFLMEGMLLGAMPAALPVLKREVEAAGRCFGEWVDQLGADEADPARHMPQDSLHYIHYLLWMLAAVFTYRGEYEHAQAVMAMPLELWELEGAGIDVVRAAWGRETLVIVQLARRQYEGAVRALLAAPCWAQVAAVGERLAQALSNAGQQRLQQRVANYFVAGQQLRPGALTQWREALEEAGRTSVVPWGLVSAAELGVCGDATSSSGSTSSDREESGASGAAHKQLAQHTFDYVQLVAVGRQADAAAALLGPKFCAVSLHEAANHVHMHMFLSMGLHHLSVPTPPQQQAVRGLVRTLWAATQQEPTRVGSAGRAHVLLSYLAWQSLNSGNLGDALATATPPAQLQQPNLAPATTATPVPATPAAPKAASGTVSVNAWQWDAAASGQAQPFALLPGAGGLVEHTCALLGLNLDLSRGTCGPPATRWCRQEIAQQAAAAVPGRHPAYALQPGGMEVLRRLLDAPAYASLRCAGTHSATAELAGPLCDAALRDFERENAMYDLLAASLAAATADDPSPTLELDAARISLQQLMVHKGTYSPAFGKDCTELSLTRAAVLGAYGCARAAAQLTLQACERLGHVTSGSDLALDVVLCVTSVMALAGEQGVTRAPAAAAPPTPPDGSVPDTASDPYSAAAAAVSSLVAALPERGAVWARPADQVQACAEAVHLLLLKRRYSPSDQAATQQLLQRAFRTWQPDPPPWSDGQLRAVPLLLHMWSAQPDAVREEAFARLVQLLRAALLPRWPRGLAGAMGAALADSPAWALAQQLGGLWRCWDESSEGMLLLEEFASRFVDAPAMQTSMLLLPEDIVKRMMCMVRMAVTGVWGRGHGTTATGADAGGASSGASTSAKPSTQLMWVLRRLFASWAQEPHGQSAVEGRAWCVTLVREARCKRVPFAGAIAALIARRASGVSGMEGLAEAVMAEAS